MTTHDVFISHAAEDKEIANAICAALEEQGTACWIAPRDMRPGFPYAETIVEAISTARALVLILSASANASPHVAREVERAGSRGTPIVTFKLDSAPLTRALEFFLSQSHWLEATAGPREQHLARLAGAVSALLREGEMLPATAGPPQTWNGNLSMPAANPLYAIWESLDPNLQDAFSLAYNKKRREGSRRVSTRDFFQALARIEDRTLQLLLASLPAGALPEPIDASVPADRHMREEPPLLSDCVADSLTHFRELGPLPRRISATDLFVDIAKHGHGPSVARLRRHGVGPSEIEAELERRGLAVIRREDG